MKTRTWWGIGLLLIGLCFTIGTVVWITVIEPAMEKLPGDLDEHLRIDATVRQVFPVQTEETVSIERTQQAIMKTDGVLVIRESIIPNPEVPGVLEGSTTEMGVDRTSREFVAGYGDRERTALWNYPLGVKKETYSLWSDTAGRALDARFTGEGQYRGLLVYTFVTDEQDLPYGNDPVYGLPVVVDLVIEERVEPKTGITVYGEAVRTFSVLLPTQMVQMLPEDVRRSLPEATDAGVIKVMAVVVNQQYSDETVAEKISDARDYRTKLLWATRYGLWLGFGSGSVFILVSCWLIIRTRSFRRRSATTLEQEPSRTTMDSVR